MEELFVGDWADTLDTATKWALAKKIAAHRARGGNLIPAGGTVFRTEVMDIGNGTEYRVTIS